MEHKDQIVIALGQLEKRVVSLENRLADVENIKRYGISKDAGQFDNQIVKNAIIDVLKRHESFNAPFGNALGLGDWNMKVSVLAENVTADLALQPGAITAQRMGRFVRSLTHVRISDRTRNGYFVFWNRGDLE